MRNNKNKKKQQGCDEQAARGSDGCFRRGRRRGDGLGLFPAADTQNNPGIPAAGCVEERMRENRGQAQRRQQQKPAAQQERASAERRCQRSSRQRSRNDAPQRSG